LFRLFLTQAITVIKRIVEKKKNLFRILIFLLENSIPGLKKKAHQPGFSLNKT